jgi:hypothetical protein
MGLDDLLGTRRAPNIGISPEEYRKTYIKPPDEEEILKISKNPRNAYGIWYERHISNRLDQICSKKGWTYRSQVSMGYSKVYLKNRYVDIVVNDRLGLELKFLKGDGSLVKPKSLIDALDFTIRPIDSIYLIDGPGWLSSGNVEYLNEWWTFTNSANLKDSLVRYFEKSGPD